MCGQEREEGLEEGREGGKGRVVHSCMLVCEQSTNHIPLTKIRCYAKSYMPLLKCMLRAQFHDSTNHCRFFHHCSV